LTGSSSDGRLIDWRKRVRILPSTRGNTLPLGSTVISRMNQSVSFAELAAYSTADTGPANVYGLSNGFDTYTQ